MKNYDRIKIQPNKIYYDLGVFLEEHDFFINVTKDESKIKMYTAKFEAPFYEPIFIKYGKGMEIPVGTATSPTKAVSVLCNIIRGKKLTYDSITFRVPLNLKNNFKPAWEGTQ